MVERWQLLQPLMTSSRPWATILSWEDKKTDTKIEKMSRERISLVLSDATASKATLEEKWSSVLIESVILLNLER